MAFTNIEEGYMLLVLKLITITLVVVNLPPYIIVIDLCIIKQMIDIYRPY